MARSVNKSVTSYEVTITTNPNFAGVGAGGVQFAHGKAVITDSRMADWFREHKGYNVKEIVEAEPATDCK